MVHITIQAEVALREKPEASAASRAVETELESGRTGQL